VLGGPNALICIQIICSKNVYINVSLRSIIFILVFSHENGVATQCMCRCCCHLEPHDNGRAENSHKILKNVLAEGEKVERFQSGVTLAEMHSYLFV